MGDETRIRLVESIVAGSDREAGRHALYVILEGARQRLVEIVDIKQQKPLRRAEYPEVRQLRVQSGSGRVLQVGRHDLRRTSVEGEGRDHHPTMPNGHQVRVPGGILLLEQSHWVRTIRGGHPVVLTVYGRPFPRVLTLGASLVEARVVDLLPALARDFVRAALA